MLCGPGERQAVSLIERRRGAVFFLQPKLDHRRVGQSQRRRRTHVRIDRNERADLCVFVPGGRYARVNLCEIVRLRAGRRLALVKRRELMA